MARVHGLVLLLVGASCGSGASPTALDPDAASVPIDTSRVVVADLAPPAPAPDLADPDLALDAAVPAVDGPADAGATTACGSTPSPRNVVIPFLDRIFDGDFRLVNHFDHDEPKEFTDKNGRQVDWCGRVRTSEIDGHSGYDFALPVGTPLLASADGVVNWAGNDIKFFCPLKNQEITDQLRVEITHRLPDGRRITSNYKHLSRVDVKPGQMIRAGALIGLSGNTGCSTGPHLHFENWVMDGTKTGKSVLIDPFGWEGEGGDPWAGKPDGSPSIWLWKAGQAPKL
jgi:murein DD-endopeptidase MepM/ murein hydrolase activator NlpD